MTSSSSSSFSSKHDVFLSFRGEDTRTNFTSHLFIALSRKKINTFIDTDINKGERISANLLNAKIEGSKISIIIFSKNYADSKWCLDELVKILDCKQKKNQIVIPVFYHVHPSNVRKQTGSFGKAFIQHEKEFKKTPEMVKKWKIVLTEASYLSGHESIKFRDEAKLVDVIVEDVLNKLQAITVLTDSNGLVGINQRIKEVQLSLCVGLSDFRIVGIWGMGGIGKTTIAEALYKQISKEFEGKCFMQNVRESEERVGLVNLRNKVLSQLLSEKIKIGGPIPPLTIERLRCMKVLIVLDDVNKLAQLECLAIGHDAFGLGSRIIVTTRDRQVLESYRVDPRCIYEVPRMNYKEALEHLCNFAFGKNLCPQEFTELSKRVVDYVQGNPLALKVLGSFLYPKSKLEWEKALYNLRLISSRDILDVLKISYKELEPEVQNIFLDIACFFKGDDEDLMISMFEDHDLINHVLDVLVKKSLITRSFGKLEMHDLLQEMGQRVVYKESPEEPGRRSRLWDHKDVYDVLRKNKGTNSIKSIFLNLSKIKDMHLDSKVFADMDNLRYLKFYMPSEFDESSRSSKVHLPQGLKYLHGELRYLHWDGYPLITLPRKFIPKNLIQLNISYSKIEQLWKGRKEAPNLKFIDLRHCDYLCSLADPLEAPNLERMFLSYCEKLSYIPSSIQNFNNLGLLSLIGCNSLSCFPPVHFRSSIKIEIHRCMNLSEFPPISGNVIELWLAGAAIEHVSSSIGRLTSLKKLDVRHCPWLKSISTDICKLKSLSSLVIWFCPNLERFPEILEPMESLVEIHLQANNIRVLPYLIKSMKGDEQADTHGCRELLLPSLSGLSGLRSLILDRCDVREIPQDIGCLSSLVNLDLWGNEFESLPTSIKQLSRLKSLVVRDCNMLESLPELPRSLIYLIVCNCKRLESLPELPERLESLDASELETPPQSSHSSIRLKYAFYGCPKLDEKASNILADSQLRFQHMATVSMYERMTRGFEFFLCGSPVDIPEWLSNRCSGSSITIQLPPQCGNTRFIGFGLCFVVGFKEFVKKDIALQGKSYSSGELSVKCRYCFESQTVISKTIKHYTSVDSDKIILEFEPCSNYGLPDVDSHTAVSFDFSVHERRWEFTEPEISGSVEVKCCGVCPVYAHPNECPPNTFTVNLVPPTEEECMTLHTEFHDEAGTSGTTAEIGSIDRSDQEQIIAPQQESSFLSETFRCLGLDCSCLRGVF